jgi:hypothetical protein
MKKKIIIRGPMLSLSGYGMQARFALQSLKEYDDHFDIYLVNTQWGATGEIVEESEETQYIISLIHKTQQYVSQGGQFDISLQITIPNEWEQLAPVNVGFTAGIETNKIALKWIEKALPMSRIIVVSEHAKYGFDNTTYEIPHPQTQQPVTVRCGVPVEVVGFPAREITEEVEGFDLGLATKFNFLSVSQWGPRKNVENTVRWFVEEFKDDPEVGLVLKTSIRNNSTMDFNAVRNSLKELLKGYKDRKCKVYLLHGDLTDQQLLSLYKKEEVKATISISHGECWGLPMFESVCNGLPVVCPTWGGQNDYIYAKVKKKKTGKIKNKALVAKVDYELKKIDAKAVWDDVLDKNSSWCYPKKESYKQTLRDVYKNYPRYKKQAELLQKNALEAFEMEKMKKKFAEAVLGESVSKVAIEDLPKTSLFTSVFKAEEYLEGFFQDIVRQTMFQAGKLELVLVHPKESPTFEQEEKIINKYLRKHSEQIKYVVPEEEDKGVYWAWNIGIENSTGEYLSNANVDDRKSADSVERHARALYTNSDVSVVYAGNLLTQKPNETFEQNTSNGRQYHTEHHSKEAMLRGNAPHCMPMFRASMVERYGSFSEEYRSASDWEYWLRLTFGGEKFKKLDEPLGLYYFNPTGVSTNPDNNDWKQKEERKIFLTYQQKYNEEKDQGNNAEQVGDIIL